LFIEELFTFSRVYYIFLDETGEIILISLSLSDTWALFMEQYAEHRPTLLASFSLLPAEQSVEPQSSRKRRRSSRLDQSWEEGHGEAAGSSPT